MGFSKKFVTHPNPRSVKSIHEHIKGVHDLFINAGFTQSGDVDQYNFDVEPSFDYSVFLSTTSVGTTYNYGRLVYEFPDYYDDDGNDFKLKIIIVFELIKNTAYSNDNIDNVSINFFHNICITDSTNGESRTANSNMGQYRHGYYLPSSTNDTTRKSYPHTQNTMHSIVSYNKTTKTIYINICPNYRFGFSGLTTNCSLSLLVGTYARDFDDELYVGVDNTFNWLRNYIGASNDTNASITTMSYYRSSSNSTLSLTQLNLPMTLVSTILTNGNTYFQQLMTQTTTSGYVSPSKNILMCHRDFAPSHNQTFNAYVGDEYVGRFVCVDVYNFNKSYLVGDSTGVIVLLVRVDDE